MKEKVIICLHCGNKTSMKVVANHDLMEHEEIWDYSVNYYSPAYITSFFKQWEMYLCPVCTEVTIQRTTSFSEETEPNGNPIKYTDTIFPLGFSENKHLPSPVRDAFEAALKVRNLDGAVCIMALRRTLEKMCKHKNAKGKDLFSKLKDLQSENILPPIMEGISYILRKEGNSAAHADDKEFSSETVKLMIEFTEVILDYVYSLPAKIEKAQLKLNQDVISNEESEL
ncbi:DUF4145 domain-containing protein [Paenibacillus protaetiae]|uniref:DUF4145 domain-containing protein n=1 Tax=Paenibacillus protaetiae TaxID=2509456 RepID=A0A4P6EXX8_9BACL|nr:DUF4145 domain-containing protein [Paenibacillus protaetiae]QAY67535.1 DUF4145 domain-containing protein [Paenibacillus protaetiae]